MFEQTNLTGARQDARGRAAPAFDVMTIVGALRRRRGLIATTTLLAVLGGVVVTQAIPARYTSVVQVLMQPRDLKVVDKAVTDRSGIIDSAAQEIESQARLLTSETVLRRVIDDLSLTRDREFNGSRESVLSFLTSAFASPSTTKEDPSLAALETLRKRVAVKTLPRTYVVELSVYSSEPQKAARIANAIAQGFFDDQASARANAARRASASLSSRLDELRGALQAAETAVEEYKKKFNIVTASGQWVKETQAAEVNSQLLAAKARTAEKRARYELVNQVQKGGADAAPELLQSATIAALRTQYATVARREAELSSSLGPRHPAVLDVKAELARVRGLVNDEIQRVARAARSDYEQAKATEAALSKSADTLASDMVTTRDSFVRLRELERDAQAKRSVYETFAVRAKEIGEQEWVDTNNARVISTAEPAPNRSWPPSGALLLGLSALLGIGAGAGLALMREQFDRRIWNARQLAERLGIEPIASFPTLETLRGGWLMRKLSRKPKPASPADDVFALADTLDRGADRAVTAQMAALSDVIAAATQRGSMVAFLSPGADRARSAVALAVALHFQKGGRASCLIDGDLDTRDLTVAMGAADRVGLHELADGGTAAAATVIQDAGTGLRFVPAGARSKGIAAPMATHFSVLAATAQPVSLVAIDGSPHRGGAAFRAAVEAAQHIVLVASTGEIPADEVERLVASLGAARSKIIGLVACGGEMDAV